MPLFPSGNPYSSTTGQVTIVAGDDYKAADGRACVIGNALGTWVNLTNAQVYFVGQGPGNFPPQQPSAINLLQPLNFPLALIAPILGTVVTPTGNQSLSFDLPAASTGVQPNDTPTDLYSFAVYALLPNGDVVTLITGPLQILGVS